MTWITATCAHVYPQDDLIDHELSPRCACSPVEHVTAGPEGPMFVFTHSSLDGRELTERTDARQ